MHSSPLTHSFSAMLPGSTHLHNTLLTPLLYSSITRLLSQSTFCLSMSLLHQDLHKRLISQVPPPPPHLLFPSSIFLCFPPTSLLLPFISKIQSSRNDRRKIMKTTMRAIFTPAGRITGFSSPPFPPPSSFLRRRCHLSKVHTATSRFNLHPRSFGPTTSLNSSTSVSTTPTLILCFPTHFGIT